jgi:hydrogenase maturation factor
MCWGELGIVVTVDDVADSALVRTARGVVRASVLMTPEARQGDHVTVHSGHVLSVLDATAAKEAGELRGLATRRGRETRP